MNFYIISFFKPRKLVRMQMCLSLEFQLVYHFRSYYILKATTINDDIRTFPLEVHMMWKIFFLKPIFLIFYMIRT